jgi:hypothetical protein
MTSYFDIVGSKDCRRGFKRYSSVPHLYITIVNEELIHMTAPKIIVVVLAYSYRFSTTLTVVEVVILDTTNLTQVLLIGLSPYLV